MKAVLFLLILSGCATQTQPKPELKMHDEGDRVCVLVNPDLIYCQTKTVEKRFWI